MKPLGSGKPIFQVLAFSPLQRLTLRHLISSLSVYMRASSLASGEANLSEELYPLVVSSNQRFLPLAGTITLSLPGVLYILLLSFRHRLYLKSARCTN
jgi:hypothetical protein